MLDSLLSRAVRASLSVLDAGRRGSSPPPGRRGCGYGGCGSGRRGEHKIEWLEAQFREVGSTLILRCLVTTHFQLPGPLSPKLALRPP